MDRNIAAMANHLALLYPEANVVLDLSGSRVTLEYTRMGPGTAQDGRGQDPNGGGTRTPGETGGQSTGIPSRQRKARKRQPRNREVPELADAIRRFIRAFARRVADCDPEDLVEFVKLEAAVRQGMAMAVVGIRQSERSDTEIGNVLGISRQAVEDRWPRNGANRKGRDPSGQLPDLVYVIGSEASTLVKIGHSNQVEKRLGWIATMSPIPVKVLWTCPGGTELESWLHGIFADKRRHGEWFDFGGQDPVATVRQAVEERWPR